MANGVVTLPERWLRHSSAAAAMRALWSYLTPEGAWRDKRLAKGGFILACSDALGEVTRCIGDWLEYWAARTPNALFLAERHPESGEWVKLTYAEVREQVGKLAAVPLLAIRAKQGDGALIFQLAGQALEQRALARPVRAEQGGQAAPMQVEIQAVQDEAIAPGEADALASEQGGGGSGQGGVLLLQRPATLDQEPDEEGGTQQGGDDADRQLGRCEQGACQHVGPQQQASPQ